MSSFRTTQTEASLTSRLSLAFVIAFLLFGLGTVWQGIYTVDQGFVGIVKRNGAVIDVADPGLHLKFPWIDDVVEMEVRERAAHLDMTASSHDPMLLPIKATVNWLVNKETIQSLYAEYGSLEQFEQRVLLPAFLSSTKAATSRFTVNDLLRDRTGLEDKAKELLTTKTPSRVMTITALAVSDIDFPDAYEKQVLDKQVAAEAAQTEKYNLEKQALVARQATQTAEAERDAAKARAEGKAYGIELEGAAHAKAIQLTGEALSKNPQLVEYEKVKTWKGEFPSTFMGGDSGTNTLWSMPGRGVKQ